jgi:hypothetical protein
LNNILNREEWIGVVCWMLWIHMVARRFSGLGWLGDTLLHLQYTCMSKFWWCQNGHLLNLEMYLADLIYVSWVL